MRPRPRKASSLTIVRRAAVVATLAALAVIFVSAGSAKPAPTGTYQVCITAGSGSSACSPTAAGGDYSIVSSLANGLQVTIKNDSTSNQTLDYANLPVPATIGTINTGLSAAATNYSAYASTSTPTTLQLRNLGLAPGVSQTIAFVMSPAASCTDGAWAPLVAQSAANGNFYTFPQPTVTGGLTTLVSGGCTLDFTVQPTAALENAVVTGQAYTPGAADVTVAPHTKLPVPLNIGSASITSVDGPPDPGSTLGFSGTGPVGFSGGSVVFTGLQDSGTGGPFTLTAHAAGFTDAVSLPFVITQDGNGQCGSTCPVSSKFGSNPLVSIATGPGFSFVGASPSGVPTEQDGTYPAGCQGWTPTPDVSGFVEFDGRTSAGSMTITYYVSQSALKARYGKNVGNQFTPICFGAKWVDSNNVAQDCHTNPSPTGGWWGQEVVLNPATGLVNFDGKPAHALCGAGGYYWGILSSYQQSPVAGSPFVASWNGSTQIGGNFRSFNIAEPSGWDGRGGC